MPSFDIVSEVDKHELANAVDQANRELVTRFDFKGVDASFSLDKNNVTLVAPSDFQVSQMEDILRQKMSKRGIDARALEAKPVSTNLAQAKQVIEVRQGLSQPAAKQIIKLIKDAGNKVQASIQGEQIRVTGKKRDDLQEVMGLLRADETLELPVQFTNFRE